MVWTLHIAIDGSTHRGRGGWAARIEDPAGKAKTIQGMERTIANQGLALISARDALGHTPEGAKVKVHAASKYLQQGVQEWIPEWRKTYWRGNRNRKILNRELWMELEALLKSRKISWVWGKADKHSTKTGIHGEIQDLATEAKFRIR